MWTQYKIQLKAAHEAQAAYMKQANALCNAVVRQCSAMGASAGHFYR